MTEQPSVGGATRPKSARTNIATDRRTALVGARRNRKNSVRHTNDAFRMVMRWWFGTVARLLPAALALSIASPLLRNHPRLAAGAMLSALFLGFQGAMMFPLYHAVATLEDADADADLAESARARTRRQKVNAALNDDLRLAGDLVGRMTVVAIVWAMIAYLWAQTRSGPSREPLTFEQLRSGYLDLALVIGPLIGVVWWVWRLWRDEGKRFVDRQDLHHLDGFPLAKRTATLVGEWSVPTLQVVVSCLLAWGAVALRYAG